MNAISRRDIMMNDFPLAREGNFSVIKLLYDDPGVPDADQTTPKEKAANSQPIHSHPRRGLHALQSSSSVAAALSLRCILWRILLQFAHTSLGNRQAA